MSYNPQTYGSAGINQLTGDITAGPGSGSQAAAIAANAVATSKIATNAVSQSLFARAGSSLPIGATTINTQTITTTGGPVVILAFADFNIGATTATGTHGLFYHVTRDGNSVPGGRCDPITYAPSGFSLGFPCCMVLMDQQVAGTYTYQFTYTQSGPEAVNATIWAFSVIELKR
jgi:hypothetical protein